MNKADVYKERRYLLETIKHSQTAQQKMKIMRIILVSKEILSTFFNYSLLCRSLFCATCVIASMVVVVVGPQQDVMEGTVMGVVGLGVEMGLDQGLEEVQEALGDLE